MSMYTVHSTAPTIEEANAEIRKIFLNGRKEFLLSIALEMIALGDFSEEAFNKQCTSTASTLIHAFHKCAKDIADVIQKETKLPVVTVDGFYVMFISYVLLHYVELFAEDKDI